MRITKSGFYNLTDAEYFADPCLQPSLTQSHAKILLDRSPRHAWHAHPRLNEHFVEEDERKFDLGTCIHAMLFGGRTIVPFDFPDWRTNAAKSGREIAIHNNEIPVLAKVHTQATHMRAAFLEQVDSYVDFGDESAGKEVTAIVKLSAGLWLRTKMDWIAGDRMVVMDYKSTREEVRVSTLEAYAIRYGWDVQAAMHDKILSVLAPETAGKRGHMFALQEAYPPYAVYRCAVSESLMQLGHGKLSRAIAVWAHCLKSKRWPGPELVHVMAPAWAVSASAGQQLDLLVEEGKAA